jgi:hypothetical protein
METEQELNLRILSLTLRIQEQYPALYRNLHEMYATLPIVAVPVINIKVLGKWYESLRLLVLQYDEAHHR